MAGVTLEYDGSTVLLRLGAMADRLADSRQMFEDMGEALLASTRKRFDRQAAPDGTKWQALKPACQRRRKRTATASWCWIGR